ncbi:cytochrome c biogenesis protein CcsA [Iamia sp.]|uniref:cytochrome c biogenesis protein CcsA n=1 Tax=Iamia sp. TaxID=2722710 RepID=UPI002BFC8CCA|nr:cytochrome c biogenesis protein CcsA [Iamia sp.]HXH58027.1 cytochrome c biogenesis protein CcsA [Iamia sp.]
MNDTTASKATRVLGAVTLAGIGLLVLFGLVISGPDGASVGVDANGAPTGQGEVVRIMYMHVPTALIAFLAFFVTVAGSVGYLLRRSEWWDLVAHASAELGAVLLFATLVTGALWGEPTWGTYWEWQDARLTTTAVLFFLVLGYLAVRRLPLERGRRSRLAAVVGLLLGPATIVCHYATTWWRTLHQGPTISRLDPQIEGTMLFSLMLGMGVFMALYAWLMLHRFRVLWLENRVEDLGLDLALAERRAEAGASGASTTGPSPTPATGPTPTGAAS